MEKDSLYRKWKETQLEWDDTEFLEKKANKLMKKRWERLNSTIVKMLEAEVVVKNEYLALLDIGAGRGDFYRHAADTLKKYTGIEPSSSMLKNSIIEDDFELKQGRGEDLSYEDEFDACLIKEVLDHCYEPGKVIENAGRALKKGGLLIISLTNKNSYYKLILKKKAKELEKQHKDHLYNFNEEEVIDLIKKAGLETEKVKSINYLRMPAFAENIAGSFPKKLVFLLLDVTDRFFRLFLKGKGGSFIITARKAASPGDSK